MLTKAVGWLIYYVLPLCLAVAAVVAATGVYLYYQDTVRLEMDRNRAIEQFMEKEEELLNIRRDLEDRIASVRREITEVQMELNEAQRTAHRIRSAMGFWERLLPGNNDRAEELAAAEERAVETRERLAALEGRQAELVEGMEETQARIVDVRMERAALGSDEPELVHYAGRSWERVRGAVLFGVAAVVAGPSLFKLSLFYLWAPWIRFAQPVLLGDSAAPQAPVRATESGVSLSVEARPGETVLVREKFLQSSDEGLRRRTKFVFDWRVPLSSLVCGLTELIQMRNRSEADTYHVTFSTKEEPMTELAVMEISEGGSLVLRPRFLAGVVMAPGSRMEIRRYWRIFSWHAWIAMRFRYFEFCGPCRLVVCGNRGVRAERLEGVRREENRARRVRQTATIGFTPQLRYHVVRTETFWSFFRGRSALFDDMFTGTGVFVCQEIAEKRTERGLRRLWAGVWNGILKIFGL